MLNASAQRNVGVIVVHGIGEEKRFEHLEDRVRKLTAALTLEAHQQGRSATVEVLEPDGSALFASTATWRGNREPSVVLHLSASAQGLEPSAPEAAKALSIWFHEVWWADINDQPGVMRDVSFWIWALTVWLVPEMQSSSSRIYAENMIGPAFPPGQSALITVLVLRLKLFLVCCIALLATSSMVLLIQIAKRIFNLDLASLKAISTFISYIACIKIYAQDKRFGGDPLDGIDEPPRFAIRRRMVRTLIDVALRDYDAWYVLAHSMGSVIAFNGLMEADCTLVNYLDRERFVAAQKAFAASPVPDPAADSALMPHRPAWVPQGARLDRSKLFARLGGLLTYGSPLDKFAAIWPAKVPINIDEAALAHARWFNVYDPTDPVGHELVAFGAVGTLAFAPRNICYGASPIFLQSHQCYLDDAGPDALAAGVLRWIEGDVDAHDDLLAANAPRRFVIRSAAAHWRAGIGLMQALLFFCVLAFFSAWSTTWLLTLLKPDAFAAMANLLNAIDLHPLAPTGIDATCSRWPDRFGPINALHALWRTLAALHRSHGSEMVSGAGRSCFDFVNNAVIVTTFAVLSIPMLVFLAGVVSRLLGMVRAPRAAITRSADAYLIAADELHRSGLEQRRTAVRAVQAGRQPSSSR